MYHLLPGLIVAADIFPQGFDFRLMKSTLTLLLLAAFLPAFGQQGILFKGTINHTIQVTVYLSGLREGTNADPVLGAYQYEGKDGYLLLNGYHNNAGAMVLVEQASVNFSGVFLGTLRRTQLSGKWISADQRQTYPFSLVEVAATKEQLAPFQRAIKAKAAEFRQY